MNKTKVYTIVFVVVCFIGIGIGGIYNSFQPVSHLEVQDKIDKTEEKPKEESTKPSQKEPEEKDKVQEKPKQEETPKKEKPVKPTKPQETKPEQKPVEDKPQETPVQPEEKPAVTMFHINLTITGLDGSMGQGIVEVEEGKSGFDVLKKFCDQKGMTIKTTGFGPIIYVSGINGLNEFDHGPQSGWVYQVNGIQPNKSSGSYIMKDGDTIEWIYKTSK